MRGLNTRPVDDPFDLRDGRAMVSLGPVSAARHCTYSCPFCYVPAGFLVYPRLPIPEIVDWLRAQSPESFDIVYVSGDTDSFAPPRTEQGLQLLEALLPLHKDILFTTRTVFDEEGIERLAAIASRCRESSQRLFGCVSVAQASMPGLEPSPIPAPEKRVAQLHSFRDMGMASILAMRPFLPGVPTSDYEWILERSLGGVDAVLGEVWYADTKGELETKVFGSQLVGAEFHVEKMPFDSNDKDWKVFLETQTETFVREWCERHELPFYMRSRGAIDWIREHG